MLGLNSIFAKIFKTELQSQHISLSRLAEMTGKGKSTLSEKLNGKRALTTSDIDAIADKLGLTIEVKKKDDK